MYYYKLVDHNRIQHACSLLLALLPKINIVCITLYNYFSMLPQLLIPNKMIDIHVLNILIYRAVWNTCIHIYS